MKDVTPHFNISPIEEAKLRSLAIELAKDILEPEEILSSLDLSLSDYEDIKNTRAFRELYTQALTEWKSAANTQKRVRLLAATTVEAALPTFWKDFNSTTEPLTARVGLLNALAKVGGLGQTEMGDRVALPGQTFKLEIHLADREETITINSSVSEEVKEIEDESEEEFDPFE
jgi:hypothetical protein